MAGQVADAVTPAMIGQSVSVTLKDAGADAGKTTFTGIVFAVDEAAGTVIFRTPKAHTWGKADYLVLDRSVIERVQVQEGSNLVPPVRDFTSRELADRLQLAASRERGRIATKGRGVSPEAQKLFDHILKNFPRSRWQDKVMVIQDVVVITPPYGIPSISFAKNADEEARKAFQGAKTRLEQLLLMKLTEMGVGKEGLVAAASGSPVLSDSPSASTGPQ